MAADFDMKAWVDFVMKYIIPGILVMCLLLVLFTALEGENLFGDVAGNFFGTFSSSSVHL